MEQFRNALSVAPGNAQYRLALGLSLERADHPDEALVYLDGLLKRDPDNGAANLGIARIAAAQHRASDPVTYYHWAIYGSWPASQEQNRMQARWELADFLHKGGQQAQAIASCWRPWGRTPMTTQRKRRSDDRCCPTVLLGNLGTFSAKCSVRTISTPKGTRA